ncbi:MAG: LD-carboxypeptidase, partial [Myxococcota bacterium]
LLNTIAQYARLTTFHAPVIASTLFCQGTQDSQKSLRHALFGTSLEVCFPSLQGTLLKNPYIPKQTTITAPIFGGNLSLLVSMIGTPWQIATQPFILLLEDINEPPYRIDRMFQQIKYSGMLDKVKAIALGDFGTYQDQYTSYAHAELWHERLGLTIPILAHLPVGHIPNNHTVPIGTWTTLDIQQQCLRPATTSEIAQALLDDAQPNHT